MNIPALEYRHPYRYASQQSKPVYWYALSTGTLIFPDGLTAEIGKFSLTSLLDGIKSNIEQDYPRAKNAVLFVLAGRLIKNRPIQEWFQVSHEWTRETLLWGKLIARYRHNDGLKIFLYGTGNFWGEERSLQAMYEAHHALETRLKDAFHVREEYHVLGDTPAQTGRELLQISLPHKDGKPTVQYPRLPDEVAELLYHNLRYQNRIETFPPPRQVPANGAWIIDGRWMYASSLWHLPIGECVQDTVNEFAGVTRKDGKLAPLYPGFYHVTVTVPQGWHHIGLIKEQPRRFDEEARYPNEPGYTFSNWITAHELALLLDNPLDMPWPVRINKRILWPDTKKITDPLATWITNLRGLRAAIEDELNEHPTVIGELHKEAVRSIVLHTIGSFLQVYTLNYTFASDDELPLQPGAFYGNVDPTPDGVWYHKIKPFSANRQRFIHPEWAASVYGQVRAKLATFALRLSYEDIISLRTDAVWYAAEPPAWIETEDTHKPGSFRFQEYLPTFTWPRDSGEMRKFVVKYHAAKRDDENLQQEIEASDLAEESEE